MVVAIAKVDGVIQTDIPARMDRLPWSRWHSLAGALNGQWKNGGKWRFFDGQERHFSLFGAGDSKHKSLVWLLLCLSAILASPEQEKCRPPFSGADRRRATGTFSGTRCRNTASSDNPAPWAPPLPSYVAPTRDGTHQRRLQSNPANSVSVTTANGAHLHVWPWAVPCRINGTPVNGPGGAATVYAAEERTPGASCPR